MDLQHQLRRQLFVNRLLTLGLFACVCALLVGQTSAQTIQPTILCRGVKVVDPQGHVRGAFMMANGAIGLRTFDANGVEQTSVQATSITTNTVNANTLRAGPVGSGIEVTPSMVTSYRALHFPRWELSPYELTFYDASFGISASISTDIGPVVDATPYNKPGVMFKRGGQYMGLSVDGGFHFP